MTKTKIGDEYVRGLGLGVPHVAKVAAVRGNVVRFVNDDTPYKPSDLAVSGFGVLRGDIGCSFSRLRYYRLTPERAAALSRLREELAACAVITSEIDRLRLLIDARRGFFAVPADPAAFTPDEALLAEARRILLRAAWEGTEETEGETTP